MTTNSLEIKLTTLTPLWTGGVDGKADRLHTTGIMGSLRWWYEVLVRSVGGTACDPGQHACIYDAQKPYNGLCDACQIFGATGWARRFKLIVTENTLQQRKPAASESDRSRSGGLIFTLSSDHPSTRAQKPRWYLSSNPLYGQVKLDIVSTAPLNKAGTEHFDSKVIGSLLQLIADRTSVGAKPQLGMGVVRLEERQSMQPLLDHLKQIVAKHEKNGDLKAQVDEELPCLQNMFFARVKVQSATESDTFDIKYDLRGMFRQKFKNDDLRHTIMGFVRGRNRVGAKIMMSYPYEDGTIRIWGWVPTMSLVQVSRNDILNEIYYLLVDTYGEENMPFWLDYDPQKSGTVLQCLEEYLWRQNNA
jgi:CRISPR-associated protein Cmr1